MKWLTHLVTAFCFIYILSNFIPVSYMGFVLALVCSVAPDVLEIMSGVKHRSIYFHNWVIPLATSPLLYQPTLCGIPLGYGHHLALDSLTKKGVYIGSKKRINGFLYALDYTHNILIIFLHYVVLMLFLAS